MRSCDSELERFSGREVDTAGDGFLATFDGPARAIRCGSAVVSGVRALGLEVRAGVHTGECELVGDKVAGIAVHIGARVASLAGPGEVLVSQTVKDLVAGSGIEFEDRGAHELKGVPGRVEALCRLRVRLSTSGTSGTATSRSRTTSSADAPTDLLLVPDFFSNLVYDWEAKYWRPFYERLAQSFRLILFDKRGTGLSDRGPLFPNLETRMEDVRAVLDAVGSQRAVIFGGHEGSTMACLYAATYPERTVALVLWQAVAFENQDPAQRRAGTAPPAGGMGNPRLRG